MNNAVCNVSSDVVICIASDDAIVGVTYVAINAVSDSVIRVVSLNDALT